MDPQNANSGSDEEMNQEFCHLVDDHGFAVIPNVFTGQEIDILLAEFSVPSLRRSRAGIRHVLGIDAVARIAVDQKVMELASPILGNQAVPFHATIFDKSPTSNWLVVWHQDTALPLKKKRDTSGWGPWSVKDGVNYAHAPARALEQVLAIRIHLDDSCEDNGPLRVLPGTHRSGVLTDDQIHTVSEEIPAVDCVVPRGGVLLIRPLLVHASSKSVSSMLRRVLHIEYACSRNLEDGIELAIA